ncbi:MAG: site-specific DNA-methyltransferase [Ignavibacteriaceae bacterium]|nr:site-specific DNA-methyltransferase [Ignavibacteriaceae bacterium]
MIADIKDKRTTYYTHGFHPYPAKFTPQIVNRFFNLYCKSGFTILDPFCGSGTTLVEGVLNKMSAVGIDLNPIAYIISRAKSSHYSSNEIDTIRNFISEIQPGIKVGLFANFNILPKSEISIPNFPNRSHWFQENVSYELALLKKKIDEYENPNIKNLLYCAFSKIIVKVSNQDSEVRYTAKEKNHPDGIVLSSFTDTVSNYLQALNTDKHTIIDNAEVHNGDTYEILKNFSANHFDFVITSPPYINTFDYYLYHKQRMFWLGYDHRPVRKKEIGNHHRIDTKTFKVAKAEYIQSMTQIMKEISRVSKPNSYFVMIIGDGIVEGTTIDMSQVVVDICENNNYTIEQIESINLSDTTRSFNKKFSNAPKKEHTITLKNNK